MHWPKKESVSSFYSPWRENRHLMCQRSIRSKHHNATGQKEKLWGNQPPVCFILQQYLQKIWLPTILKAWLHFRHINKKGMFKRNDHFLAAQIYICCCFSLTCSKGTSSTASLAPRSPWATIAYKTFEEAMLRTISWTQFSWHKRSKEIYMWEGELNSIGIWSRNNWLHVWNWISPQFLEWNVYPH
jgi:hypothetical protein